MRPHSKAGHLRQVQPHRSPSIGTGVQARRRAKLAVLAARTELRRGNRSMCSRMSGCSFSRQRMFETRTGATPVCLAMAAPLRNSPLSMRACRERQEANDFREFGRLGWWRFRALRRVRNHQAQGLASVTTGAPNPSPRNQAWECSASLQRQAASNSSLWMRACYSRSPAGFRRSLCLRQLSWLESLGARSLLDLTGALASARIGSLLRWRRAVVG